MRKLIGVLSALGMSLVAPGAALAQSQTGYEVEHQIMETKRQAIVAMNLPLTDEEAEDFWPLYQEYRDALKELDAGRRNVLQEFAGNFNDLDDAEAQSITDRALSLDVDRQRAKKRHLKKFDKVLSGARLFRFYQIETKLEAMHRFNWTQQIPLALEAGDRGEN